MYTVRKAYYSKYEELCVYYLCLLSWIFLQADMLYLTIVNQYISY